MTDKATDGLAGLRQQIDALDRQLLQLLNQLQALGLHNGAGLKFLCSILRRL